MLTVYGIKNCDTVKKACDWLRKNNIEYQLHDFRKDGLSKIKLQQWVENVNWETLLNRRGTTWRRLSDQDKENINKIRALSLMVEQPTLIKRPIIEHGQKIIVGFNADQYQHLFNS